jgi:hypothetical protein
MVPEDYYRNRAGRIIELRKADSPKNSELLIPIPGMILFKEIIKKHSNYNELFKKEYELLVNDYVNANALKEDETNKPPQFLHEEITQNLIEHESVKFCIDGYEKSKRYLCVKEKLILTPSSYWDFIYLYRVTNVILLEDRYNELKFNRTYSFLYNRESSRVTDTNLEIVFRTAYRYSNFSVNIFNLTRIDDPSTSKEQILSGKNLNDGKDSMHQVYIYRFWALDPSTHIPTETSYFLKFLQIINTNNPIFTKLNQFTNKEQSPNATKYPRDNIGPITNYILHAPNIQRRCSFIFYDICFDISRLTSRYCTEVAFKNLAYRNQLFKKVLTESERKEDKISFDQFLFCYINGLSITQSSNDIQLAHISDNLKVLMKIGMVNKRVILHEHFLSCIKNTYTDRAIRSTFNSKIENQVNMRNFYKISDYDLNDLLIMISESMNNDELVKYLITYHVDLVISIGQESSSLIECPLKPYMLNYKEKLTAFSNDSKSVESIGGVIRKQINFNVNASSTFNWNNIYVLIFIFCFILFFILVE